MDLTAILGFIVLAILLVLILGLVTLPGEPVHDDWPSLLPKRPPELDVLKELPPYVHPDRWSNDRPGCVRMAYGKERDGSRLVPVRYVFCPHCDGWIKGSPATFKGTIKLGLCPRCHQGVGIHE